jgi:predicted deacylase
MLNASSEQNNYKEVFAMCSSCGSMMSVQYGMNLQSLCNEADSYGRASAAAANGRYKAILDVLQQNGGCSSCKNMIEEKIRNTF